MERNLREKGGRGSDVEVRGYKQDEMMPYFCGFFWGRPGLTLAWRSARSVIIDVILAPDYARNMSFDSYSSNVSCMG